MKLSEMIDDVIKKEGGYVNHPDDRGGPTKYGITLDTLEKWRGLPVSAADVQNLSIDEAQEIYTANYYRHPGIDKLPAVIQPVVFDMAVNMGPAQAVKLMQQVLDRMSGKVLKIDGKIGPMTIAAANIAVNVYGADVVRQITERRKQFCRDIVRRKPSQSVFLKGWLARADSFLSW